MITVVTGTDIEKLKGEFESTINGMNMVGKIPYDVYSELYDVGTDCIQKAYELGKAELNTTNKRISSECHNLVNSLEKKQNEIVALKAQIEKMKCCSNCRHSRTEYEHCRTNKREKWEIKEN